MYFPYFITYIAIGLGIGLLVFFWALKNGQFRDQQRARYLPLEEEEMTGPTANSRFGRWEMLGLLILAFVGILVTAMVLAFALYNG
ncbi:MAG: cbb3-type cytochrome oxidase assembly protein CcoS [Desulfobacteraceae bacterium]|nr:cbb3-type cytochrome oxidase assembly protein CcoS [Desulfobacteraceae bacterium]